MRIESDAERSFYEIECQKQNLSVRQLPRQYNPNLYERLVLSRDKDAVMRLAQEGQTINKPDDILKNPLTLEFLGLKPEAVYHCWNMYFMGTLWYHWRIDTINICCISVDYENCSGCRLAAFHLNKIIARDFMIIR